MRALFSSSLHAVYAGGACCGDGAVCTSAAVGVHVMHVHDVSVCVCVCFVTPDTPVCCCCFCCLLVVVVVVGESEACHYGAARACKLRGAWSIVQAWQSSFLLRRHYFLLSFTACLHASQSRSLAEGVRLVLHVWATVQGACGASQVSFCVTVQRVCVLCVCGFHVGASYRM